MQPSVTVGGGLALLAALAYALVLKGLTYGVSRRFAPVFHSELQSLGRARR